MSKSQINLSTQSFVTFGELLRYLRERMQLSQRELAGSVGYHHSYISYLEKNMRVPDQATLLGRFVPALGLDDDPELVTRLLELARQKKSVSSVHKSEPVQSLGFSQSLPISLTSILGREYESAALIALLARTDVRLVSIVGPPGVGKTRLALHVAGQVGKTFPDGVSFVDLTSLTQPELVLPAIAAALGLPELSIAALLANLQSVLSNKNCLIVLDNFEQVVDAAPQLVPLLGSAAGIKLLVTSREALRVRGEQEFPLEPLPVSNDLAQDSPAVQLFIERARAVKPNFETRPEAIARVAEICRRLDGLPLAIELAAVRVKSLSLTAMLAQFERRFDWLTRGGRDLPAWRQTLWGALEWSYNLLSGQERALFNRLSIFAGGWQLEAAEEVCSDDALCASSDILGLLAQLVDKSLVAVDIEAGRYMFLETLREFACEKLRESHEWETLRQRHCQYYLKFAQTMRPHLLQGGDQVRWLNQVELEHNNLRAALAGSIAAPGQAATAMQFGWALHVFWHSRSHISEARRWLDKILALDPTPTPLRADLLRYASDYARSQGDFDGARTLEEAGLEISRVLGDEAGVYYSMDGLAMLAGMQADYPHVINLLEQVLAYRRRTNDNLRMTTTLNNLAIARRRLGHIESARELYVESIKVSRCLGNLKSLTHALNGLAEVHLELKQYPAAVNLLRESISLRQQLGDQRGLAVSFETLALALDQAGPFQLSTQLESASQKIIQELGLVFPLAARQESEAFVKRLRARLGDAVFEAAWSNGQSLSLEQIVALALADGPPDRFEFAENVVSVESHRHRPHP